MDLRKSFSNDDDNSKFCPVHRHLFNVALCSFGLSCCLSREESQVKAVWDEMATSQYVGDERSATSAPFSVYCLQVY